MDGYGIDCERHARIEELINRRALFGFEGDLANAIGRRDRFRWFLCRGICTCRDWVYPISIVSLSNMQRNLRRQLLPA